MSLELGMKVQPQLHGSEKLQRKNEQVQSVRESTPRLEPLSGEEKCYTD